VLLVCSLYAVLRVPDSQTDGAETGMVSRQQQHAHIWLSVNNTVPEILHMLTSESNGLAAKPPLSPY